MIHAKHQYKDNAFAFSDHWLARYYQQALWQQYPLLFLLLTYYAQQQHWSDQQWLQCRQQSLHGLLAAIELPATEANYCVLMDSIEMDEIDLLLNNDLSKLESLYQFFKSDNTSSLAMIKLPQIVMRLIEHASMNEVAISHSELATIY